MTYPQEANNAGKLVLIRHSLAGYDLRVKDSLLEDGPADHQLVGRVKAYQGDDG